MGMGFAWTAARIVISVGVAAALASSPGAGIASAQAAAEGDQPVAWAVTTYESVDDAPVAVDPATSTVYVGGIEGLSVLNALTGQVTGSISLGDSLDDFAVAAGVNPSTGTIYATTSAAVKVVDPGTGKVTATIDDPNDPRQVAVNPETDTIYVLNSGTITVIDGSTNTVTTTIDLSGGLGGIAVDPVTNTVYAANFETNSVSVIDGATNSVTTAISGSGHSPDHVTVDPLTGKIWVGNTDGTVMEIDAKTNTVTTIDADASGGIAVDPETDIIYTLGQSGRLGGLDGRTLEFVAGNLFTSDLPGDTLDMGLAVDPAAGTIYAVDDLESSDGSDSAGLAIISSCFSHVVPPTGSNCAKVASAFEPVAATFSSPSRGVVLGTADCASFPCFQASMMATSDGGKTWSFLRPPLGAEVDSSQPLGSGLLFTSQDNGWLFGSWHTGNGGTSWQRSVPEAAVTILAMAASKTTVYAAVQPAAQRRGELFATPVGAARWSQVPAVSGDATGLAVSGSSVWVTTSTKLWVSGDGRHWTSFPARCSGTGYELAGVTATSSSHVALLCAQPTGSGQGRRKEILVSTDGGRTVRLVGPAPGLGVPEEFASPAGDPSVITIAAGASGQHHGTYWIYRSGNGGKTWTTQTIQSDPEDSFSSLVYTNRTTGWLVLANRGPLAGNMLLQTTNSGRSWHKATL